MEFRKKNATREVYISSRQSLPPSAGDYTERLAARIYCEETFSNYLGDIVELTNMKRKKAILILK